MLASNPSPAVAPVDRGAARAVPPALVFLLRAVSAQLILWHHLAFYGPLSDLADPLAPELFSWLSRHGRLAVQVFFVLGGYTAARALDPSEALGLREVGRRFVQRYRRLAGPYLLALGIAVVASAIARRWMDHPSISAPPTLPQLLAHTLFLHDVLGYPALTTGIWYLAIDLQLQLLTLVLVALSTWLARRSPQRLGLSPRTASVMSVLVLAGAAVLWINRDASLDVWAVYFFGSYALGLLVGWFSRGQAGLPALLLLFGLVVLGSVIDWRTRLAVAAVTAALLLVASPLARALGEGLPAPRAIAYLGRTSYSLFLVHFPICLVVSAWCMHLGVTDPRAALLGMVVAWAASLGASALFHRLTT